MLDTKCTPTQTNNPSSGSPQPIKTVLLATDGSDYAETALDNAIRLTKFTNGQLVITYFADPQDCALFDGFPCLDDEEWQAYGQLVLKRLAERAREAGVQEVVTILEKHQGEEALNHLARRVNADLIMLVSHLFGATSR